MGFTYRLMEQRLASIFVSPGRVTIGLKVGTYVPKCTASFSITFEFLSAPLGETETLLLRHFRRTAKSIH
jgi:hypothetical protein